MNRLAGFHLHFGKETAIENQGARGSHAALRRGGGGGGGGGGVSSVVAYAHTCTHRCLHHLY